MVKSIVILCSLMNRLVSCLDWVVRALLAVGMGIILSAIIFHVVGRYFFSMTYMGTMELVRYTMIWVSILGAAAAFICNEHVIIDMLSNKFPEKIWFWCRIVADLILCGFFVAMIYGGQFMAIRNFSQTSLGLQIPMFYPYLAIPVGGCLMLIYTLTDLFNTLVDRCGFQHTNSEVK
ncbi:TRAP-type C4-dicarboxylate transport system, small permease component [Desulfuromusa kysingii]|uniref:TRAP-type C4-dicarboxylate transport system, small permease component n=1 Tax=Desulfuromusa kysingii TaxID=37625 RepID=A0A1H4E0V2_9BACT|nr:TRAP transporter small permease [Desulfuromusa kysingii]SEA78437.1 TRAP-type C4-dicarboxylate transport system, small permease component [Desulfuromusa kysingii]